jgi:hypothetical protein
VLGQQRAGLPRTTGGPARWPEQLGEQLALLLDGAAARTRVLNADAFPTAAAIAAVLIDNAIPATASDDRRREEVSS